MEAVARALLAKMIGELSWEEVLHPTGDGAFALPLASGRTYRFRAVRRIWDNLDVDPESLSVDGAETVDPLRFVVDARAELAMNAATEAMFLRELSNTLRQDAVLARRNHGWTAEALIALPVPELHARLEGHPKAVANKGRLGWGVADLERYAPEYAAPIPLHWIAADRDSLRLGRAAGQGPVLAEAIGAEAAAQLQEALVAAGVAETHLPVPVHPWQWQAHLEQAFVQEIAEGRIVPLGTFGPAFVATPSLRTLTPVGGGPYDVKLSLGILNTSAWRGMPGKYIEHGAAISDWLADVVAADPVLSPCVTVLREVDGCWYRHPILADCPGAPYRHHEMLGAIWRENAEHRAGSAAQAVMAAALFHRGACGRTLAEVHARAAGLAMAEWLERLFEVTVLPLWHALCTYGTGFIAHGQNVTVVLRDHVPVGMAIKDFQGDLDLVDRDFPEMSGLDPAIRALLPRKPPAYIVHDIQTAHFVTVLRFLSAGLARSGAVPERQFYDLLRQVLRRHAAAHPDRAERFALFDLFAPTMPKVCINRVRLAIGYEDSAARPLPARGTDLVNPLAALPEAAVPA
ncbi:IucA/IucC family protein [Jannaschia marina]|uniref:IucA/IucC family protein n=1 Tax=Jannaschia marina TaxID=2741674 RepID=UPI0015CE01E1|nr:IucA/IucC family protein [Jannaschia marina]